jgi:hypothetical protein
MEIIIPTKLSEVPLYQMVEYNSLPDLPPMEKTMKALSIFLNVSEKELAKFPMTVINKAITHIEAILQESPSLQKKIVHKHIKYGFEPNLDEIPLGAFVDIENYQKNPSDMWRMLSVLYRPITEEGQGHRYLIETYKGKVNENFKDLPSDVAFGAVVFFCNLGIDLLTSTLKSLKEEKEALTSKDSPKNGDGWLSSISYVEEMLQNLTKLVNYPFTPLSFGEHTKATYQQWKEQSLTNQENEQK